MHAAVHMDNMMHYIFAVRSRNLIRKKYEVVGGGEVNELNTLNLPTHAHTKIVPPPRTTPAVARGIPNRCRCYLLDQENCGNDFVEHLLKETCSVPHAYFLNIYSGNMTTPNL